MDETVSMDFPLGPSAPKRGTVQGKQSPVMVPAVVRALSVLDLLAHAGEPMGVARLASRLRLPKSSMHGLCGTMAAHGYLCRREDGSYFIGPRVMSLSQAFIARIDVAQQFNAVFEQQGGKSPEETVVLSVLDGDEVVYVAARNGHRPLALAFSVGMRLPAHRAATGKAMLAWQDEAQLRRRLGQEALRGLTPHGAATCTELLQELAAVRRRGYSIDDETVREGVYGLAAPVFDAAGRVVAGVGVCIHKASLVAARDREGSIERHREAVRHVARELTHRLGGQVPPTLQELKA